MTSSVSRVLREQALSELWRRFKEKDCQKSRERLIEEYKYLALHTARLMAKRLTANMELADLTSAGLIGLINAVDKFDPARGIQFTTFAITLIRGAILEMLRMDDWVPRSVREKQRRGEVTVKPLISFQDRLPSCEKVSYADIVVDPFGVAMGVSESRVYQLYQRGRKRLRLMLTDREDV